MPKEHLFKTLVIGAPKVGKTALIQSVFKRPFRQFYDPTIGVDFHLKVSEQTGDDIARLQLWDISGRELRNNTVRIYLKEAEIVWICIDPKDRKTFNYHWAGLVTKIETPEGTPKPDIYLVLTCSDNEGSPQVTQTEMEAIGESLKESGNFCGIYNVSAKTNDGVEKLFNDSCKNRIERVNSTNSNHEKLKNYLNAQIARPELSIRKSERFEVLLHQVQDPSTPIGLDQLIAKAREIASEHTPTYNPFVMAYNAFHLPTSLNQLNQVFPPAPAADGPKPA